LQIASAKFLAAWSLVIIAIIPTLVYFISVYLLGSPVGNIDTGATWGSYLGLIFLGGIYSAIGIFSSSVTENQIVSFILAVLFSFLFYLGFDFIASAIQNGELAHVIEMFGIEYHYQSVSRGVIDSRDVIYFLSVIFGFLYITRYILVRRKW
jgi:ABC-2 type transport system permease protein